jgi:6,7-dimethyl-8-ribityllumazine synthase
VDSSECACAQVRGATAHFDAVVSGATSGTLNAALDSGVPVIFCVMTTDTMEQVGSSSCYHDC